LPWQLSALIESAVIGEDLLKLVEGLRVFKHRELAMRVAGVVAGVVAQLGHGEHSNAHRCDRRRNLEFVENA
jgi:hypothetical protein